MPVACDDESMDGRPPVGGGGVQRSGTAWVPVDELAPPRAVDAGRRILISRRC
jgi:hypothetical protein